MKRYHWVRLYALLLMIILFAVSLIATATGARAILSEAARQRSIVRSVQAVTDAEAIIMRKISEIAETAGAEQYEKIKALASARDNTDLSETELERYFREGYADSIKEAIGKDSRDICAKLNSYLAGYAGVMTVTDDPATAVYERKDAGGNLTSIGIGKVNIRYTDPVTGVRNETVSFDIQFPDAVFHAGSDELFDYCMVAGKGIYITGRTSSVIGNVYGGAHSAEECREAEIVYGETGTYGGINILSTQLGVKADRIISGGDINANGSFVVLSPISESLECYAQRMNEIEGFSKDARITLNGSFIPTGMRGEPDPAVFIDTKNLADVSLSKLSGIEIYYDSNNDGGYTEPYRKLMSSSDVEIIHDFTGIIATPGNVIIHNDVNIEGLIICGDRIYTMGNNNIVSNAAIARSIISGEFAGAYGMRVSDYIGGMKQPHLKDPEYYVIPYK